MPSAATQMDLEIVVLSEVSQRQISYDITYMWKLKQGYKWTCGQNRNRVTDVENKLIVTEGKGGDWDWHRHYYIFSSVAQSCPTLCDPMNGSTPGLPVCHQLPEFTQTHVHWIGDAIQPSHSLPSPSPPALNLSQHQGLFKWISSLHQVAKVLEFQLQHQSFQWTPRTDFL